MRKNEVDVSDVGAKPVTAPARVARIVSDVFSPPWVMIGTQTVVALTASPSVSEALGWVAISGLFTGVLPLAFVLLGVRRGRLGDRNLRARDQRLIPILFALLMCLIGLGILGRLDAPREVFAVTLAPLASMPPFLIINHFWTKLSIHTGCMLGATAVLTSIHGTAVLAFAVPIVCLTAWARLRLGHHTLAQIVVGGVVGGTVTAAVYLGLA